MKVKVINENSSDYNKEFKVKRMNYDQTVVNYPNREGMDIFLNKDVEFITESELDEFLVKNRDFLKIRLNRGISISLYKILLETIEEQLEEFKSLNLLRDKHSVNKRGIWDKEIICVINNNRPIKITANGQNFKKIGYNIIVEEINKEEFLELCEFEIKKIQKNIKEKELALSRYGEALECVNKGVTGNKMLL
ncbi:MAG: hypothetical protein RSG52_14745 [Terrisporobacter sp.]|uniref:hypothetical protein n=1 Tax=Clostridia TaxID=186801 RepID=UPI002FCC64D6